MVTRSYDLMGRLKTVSDWTGTRVFKPDAAYGNLVILEGDLDTSDTGHYGTYTVRYTREDGSGSIVCYQPDGVEVASCGDVIEAAFTDASPGRGGSKGSGAQVDANPWRLVHPPVRYSRKL